MFFDLLYRFAEKSSTPGHINLSLFCAFITQDRYCTSLHFPSLLNIDARDMVDESQDLSSENHSHNIRIIGGSRLTRFLIFS